MLDLLKADARGVQVDRRMAVHSKRSNCSSELQAWAEMRISLFGEAGKGSRSSPTDTREYRADTVRNIDAWYQAFNVQAGDKLYLSSENRVRLW